MVLFPIYQYRVYNDPTDRLLGDQMDLFDPWRESKPLPTTLIVVPNDFRWINEPTQSIKDTLGNTQTAAQKNMAEISTSPNMEKYRLLLNVTGFNPESVKTKVEGGKIIVEAKQEERQPDGDYNIRELRKSYPLPEHADASQLTSYVTPNKVLVIEVPIRNPEVERRLAEAQKRNESLAQFGQHRDAVFDYQNFLYGSGFQPKIVDKGDNQKQLEMLLEMKNYKPNEIKVQVKNNELIVKGERRHQDANSYEQSFFLKSTTLPPGTQVEQLQSHLTDDGHLKIEAPYVEPKEAVQSVENNTTAEPMDATKQAEHKEAA